MEPKKYIKKCHFDNFDYEKELYRVLNEWTRLVQNSDRSGPANYIVTSPSVAELINSMYEPSEIEIGETRIEDNTLIQDIQLRPIRGLESVTFDFIADSWDDIN